MGFVICGCIPVRKELVNCRCDDYMLMTPAVEVLERQATIFGHNLLEQCLTQVAEGYRVKSTIHDGQRIGPLRGLYGRFWILRHRHGTIREFNWFQWSYGPTRDTIRSARQNNPNRTCITRHTPLRAFVSFENARSA